MSKIDYSHTLLLTNIDVSHITIAIKKSKGIYFYGVAMCSNQDTFSPEKGESLATQRMNFIIPFRQFAFPEDFTLTEAEKLSEAHSRIIKAVSRKPNKWKNRIEEWKDTVAYIRTQEERYYKDEYNQEHETRVHTASSRQQDTQQSIH